jgi:hypothetical protein
MPRVVVFSFGWQLGSYSGARILGLTFKASSPMIRQAASQMVTSPLSASREGQIMDRAISVWLE